MNGASLVLLFAVMSVGATSIAEAQSGSSNLRSFAESLSLKYVDCVTNWVGDNLTATATATEMADGGHSKCLRELQAFEEAQLKYILSINPPSASELGAINKARSLAADVREMTKAHMIRLIIETRSNK